MGLKQSELHRNHIEESVEGGMGGIIFKSTGSSFIFGVNVFKWNESSIMVLLDTVK